MRALTLVAVFAFSLVARADATLTLTQQGLLLDSRDEPVTDPQLAVTFRIWDESRSIESSHLVWSASCTVDVQRGRYAAVLGADGCGAPLKAADFAGDRWIELAIGSATLAPRLRVSTVPTAIFAAKAGDADKVGGLALSELDTRYVRNGAGSGGITLGGEVSVGGTLTAQGFAGNGAALTGVDAAKVGGKSLGDLDARYVGYGAGGSVTIGGALTATSFTGAGTGLTGVDAATLGGQSLGQLDGRYRRSADPLEFTALSGVPAGLGDGDQVGLTAVATGAGLTGDGTSSAPVRIADGGVGPALLAADAGSLAKVSGGLLTGAAGLVTTTAPLRFNVDTTTACATGNTGTVRWTGTLLQVCTSAGWSSFGGPPAGTQDNPAASCKAIRDAGASRGDDKYWLDPDGVGGAAAFQAFCDMTTDGGGWTLCLSNVPRGKGVAIADTNDWWITTWDKGSRVFTRGNKDAGSAWGNFCPLLAGSATQVYATVWSEANAVTKGDVCTASASWFTPGAGPQKLTCTGSTIMAAWPKNTFGAQNCTNCIYWQDESTPNTSAASWAHSNYGTHMIARLGGASAYGAGGVHWGNVNAGMATGNGGDVHCGSLGSWCYEEYWHTTKWKKSMQLWLR